MKNVAGSIEQVRADFDRIADLPPEPWSHNERYHEHLLSNLPRRFELGLDVGCGTGALTRRMALRGRRIDAIDLSPRMIEVAKVHSRSVENIDFRVANVLELPREPDRYDVIVSVATLHHMPLDQILPKMRAWLRPGGVLAILDLVEDDGWLDLVRSGVAAAINVAARYWIMGRSRAAPEARRIWEEHFARDEFLTWRIAKTTYQAALPGCRVRRHLFWRYSVIWRKPSLDGEIKSTSR